MKQALREAGMPVMETEPLKLTLQPKTVGLAGTDLAAKLSARGIVCEFFDPDYVTLMLSPGNTEEELDRLASSLLAALPAEIKAGEQETPLRAAPRRSGLPRRACTLREAMLAPAQAKPLRECPGRVLARPGVSCPPAVPILMPGEVIDEEALEAFAYYGVGSCSVL